MAPGALDTAADHLAPYAHNDRLFVITDDHVGPALLPQLRRAFQSSQIKLVELSLPAGEQSKSWQAIEQLTNWLLDQGVERSDTLVALGGGVIGDLTGFAAAIVKRGCNFVQVPTSLLAQVDSSVGGKTAINSTAGKNLVGSFNQPAFVLIDPRVLDSLPDRGLRAGYAEVIKYGLICDAEFFLWLEQNINRLMERDEEALQYAIARSCENKAKVVAADEREGGIRAILNLGHTFGHAIETATQYKTWLHGEAVGFGMIMAIGLSLRLGLISTDDMTRG